MSRFYATFMQKQAFKNHYVEIVAVNEEVARQAMFEHFGGKFMTVYSEENFSGQAEQYNMERLMLIDCIEHGHEPGYSTEYRLAKCGA